MSFFLQDPNRHASASVLSGPLRGYESLSECLHFEARLLGRSFKGRRRPGKIAAGPMSCANELTLQINTSSTKTHDLHCFSDFLHQNLTIPPIFSPVSPLCRWTRGESNGHNFPPQRHVVSLAVFTFFHFKQHGTCAVVHLPRLPKHGICDVFDTCQQPFFLSPHLRPRYLPVLWVNSGPLFCILCSVALVNVLKMTRTSS